MSSDIKDGVEIDLDSTTLMHASQLRDHAYAEDRDAVKDVANVLYEELESIEIDRKADELRRSKKKWKKEVEMFVAAAKELGENSKGMARVERGVLKRVGSTEDIQAVKSLYENLLGEFNKLKERVSQCEQAELQARQGFSSRLSRLIEYAADDLKVLKSVAGANRGKHKSFFNVDAEVLNREGIQKLIDEIMAEVDVLEEQRRERVNRGMSEPADEGYREDLQSRIRDKLYKKIFSNPSITYVNGSIRAAGDANDFNEKLSEGQKAALSLMWTIRLADFAVTREAKRISSRRSQLKAMDMSENIIIIDGLFSNLSNTKLIESSMAGIENTRGSFQLIGLIHNPHYQNDFSKFPVFIIGKTVHNNSSNSDRKEWLNFTGMDEMEHAEQQVMRTAQIRRIPAVQVGENGR